MVFESVFSTVESLEGMVNNAFKKTKGFFKNKFFNYLLSLNLLATPLMAGNVTIDGHVFDKKGRNVEQVDVSYKRGESVLSSAKSSVFGYELFLTMNAVSDGTRVVTDYFLKQNYPNPFNPVTSIDFSVLEHGVFAVYNLLGQEVAKKEFVTAGNYSAVWGGVNKNGEAVSSGIYIYTVKTASKKETKKMTLLDGGRSGGLEVNKNSSPVFASLAKTVESGSDTL
ncbi:MAG: T9SS type A sorting domain-containing protein, partial [Nanoarchaeota archaeon]|nr:T9SS type A sorting domain-containing protein [Nanoarchaeota archaeon]